MLATLAPISLALALLVASHESAPESAPDSIGGAVSQAEFSVAINVAGKQRMYSQKMTKEFLLAALHLDDEQNRTNAKATIGLFGKNLDALVSGDKDLGLPTPPNPELTKQLKVVAEHWTSLRAALEGGLREAQPSAAVLAEIQKLNLTVLDEMNKTVSMYEDACKAAGYTTSGTVINIAGRQRMLSQKMAKDVCFIALGVDPAGSLEALKKSQQLFTRSLKGLVEGDTELGLPALTSDSIKKQLAKVDGLWKPFSTVIDDVANAGTASPEALKQVSELNPQVLNEMNKAVTMLEGASTN